MRHFLLAVELPAIFTLALVGAFLAAAAAPAFLSPAVVLEARPYVVAFFLLAALWCFILWLILLLPRPLPRQIPLSRPATPDHPSTR